MRQAIGDLLLKCVDQFDSREEPDALVMMLYCLHADRRGEMVLPSRGNERWSL